jgi:hypothetical protein
LITHITVLLLRWIGGFEPLPQGGYEGNLQPHEG